jgi:GNAT superfamily N-acetyltransferase
VDDAADMGRMMVTTWLAAHRSHIPPGAWQRRREQWTPEVSARGWERVLRERDAAPDRTRACYLVAQDEHGAIIAIAAAAAAETDPTGTVGEVGSLYVRRDHQRRGLGRRLMQHVAACLAEMGFGSLHIAVVTANLEARRFYEALGGQDIGERLFDEDGDLLPERVYAWPDITSLARPAT